MSSRKSIPKKTRLLVWEKCNRHCAYCGCELKYEDMQVDHVESIWKHDFSKFYRGIESISEEQLHNLDNLMPACRACNFYKSSWDLEAFRDNLSTMLYRNLASNFNYKLLKKYGLIKENIHPVKFYFEKLQEGQNE